MWFKDRNSLNHYCPAGIGKQICLPLAQHGPHSSCFSKYILRRHQQLSNVCHMPVPIASLQSRQRQIFHAFYKEHQVMVVLPLFKSSVVRQWLKKCIFFHCTRFQNLLHIAYFVHVSNKVFCSPLKHERIRDPPFKSFSYTMPSLPPSSSDFFSAPSSSPPSLRENHHARRSKMAQYFSQLDLRYVSRNLCSPLGTVKRVLFSAV